MYKITNETEYEKALEIVDNLMKKGEDNVTEIEANTIEAMAKEIQSYERVHYPFPMPKSITDMVELKMLEKKINRVGLAAILGIDTPKLSQIMNGKRKPDVGFLKSNTRKIRDRWQLYFRDSLVSLFHDVFMLRI